MKKVKIKSDGTFNPLQKLIDLGYKDHVGYWATNPEIGNWYYGESNGEIKRFHDKARDFDSYEEIFLDDKQQSEEKKIIEIQKVVRVYPNGYDNPTKTLRKALGNGWLVKMVTVLYNDDDQIADYILYKMVEK